jgi:hypothetical protein
MHHLKKDKLPNVSSLFVVMVAAAPLSGLGLD